MIPVIADLAARPDLRAAVASLMTDAWPGWYGPGGKGDAAADLAAARADAPPIRFVALLEGDPVGTAGLLPRSIASHPHLGPWLGGLAVAPAQRRRGLGDALVAAVEARADALGVATLYGATETAGGLLTRRGWRATERAGALTIFTRPRSR